MVTRRTLVTMKASAAKTIPAGEFKATCLAVLDEVEATGHPVVVTKRGRPVARVVPIDAGGSTSLRGSVLFEEDLVSPIDVVWDAEGEAPVKARARARRAPRAR